MTQDNEENIASEAPDDDAEHESYAQYQFKNVVALPPTLIQMEVSECGAASLGIILAYYKKFIPLEDSV